MKEREGRGGRKGGEGESDTKRGRRSENAENKVMKQKEHRCIAEMHRNTNRQHCEYCLPRQATMGRNMPPRFLFCKISRCPNIGRGRIRNV